MEVFNSSEYSYNNSIFLFVVMSGRQRLSRKSETDANVRIWNQHIPVGDVKGDTVHFYAEGSTLCSFWDKGRSPVLLLSTQHSGQQNRVEGKPPIVEFYNSTKSGVDNLDKLVRTYPSKRKCRRWPYSVVMSLFDSCIIAARILMNTSRGAEESH